MWLPSFHATQLLQLLCLQVFVVKCGMSIHLFNPYQPPVYGFTLDNSIDHYTYLMQNISQHMKDYVTPYPQTYFGMYDQKCAFPRGKVLGGTSAINYMIYNRGNRRDFDRWAQEGNYGWSYNEVLPYFKKSERAMLKGLENSPYHNRNGNLNVEYVAYRTAPARAFLKGARQAGYRKLDYNGESQVGTSYVQATTSRGVRHSAASAFLRPIMHNRPNLKILINSHVKDYLFGKGLFTMIGGVESLTFYKSPNSQDPPDWPDAEIIQLGGSFASDEGAGVSRGMNIRRDIYEAVYKPLERYPTDHWSAFVMQFRPKSIGYLRLQDKNPWHWPKFYPNYFKYEEDLEILLEATKEVIRISQTPAMQAIGTRIWDRPLPNCAHLHFGTDDYWRCSIRTLSCTLHHQVGTCKMGLSSDPTTIVDPHLHVHGIQRLRVADNSIIPYPITGHTNAVSFMIGEKCADMIKADWVDERMQKTKITFH
uniref:Glucose-methanol-choline oxidoreductase N-terminal domain-containing protein n=2 Tax=Lutzomyia longipalpis TaxID=7200 RepID=A0A1B0CHA4_LUTLO